MKTFVSGTIILTGFLFTNLVWAHGGAEEGHSHASAPAVSEAQVSEISNSEIKSLIEKKKLDPSWANSIIKRVYQLGPKKDWVVQLQNSEKKDIYIIVSQAGEVKAVNHTGAKKPHSHRGGTPHTH